MREFDQLFPGNKLNETGIWIIENLYENGKAVVIRILVQVIAELLEAKIMAAYDFFPRQVIGAGKWGID